jgi:hypothetical protein
MMSQSTRTNTEQRTDRWPPWWVYLIVIVASNGVRRVVFPRGDMSIMLDVVIALGFTAVIVVLTTMVYRWWMRSRR